MKIEKVKQTVTSIKTVQTKKEMLSPILNGIEPLSAVAKESCEQENDLDLSEKDSIGSASIGSIEQRLAEMTSPVRTVAEVLAEQNGGDKYCTKFDCNQIVYVLFSNSFQNKS